MKKQIIDDFLRANQIYTIGKEGLKCRGSKVERIGVLAGKCVQTSVAGIV